MPLIPENTIAEVYVFALLGAALLSVAVTPLAIRLARASGILDLPGLRKIHVVPTPRLGGLSVVVATMVIAFLILTGDGAIGKAFRQVQAQVMVMLSAALAAFITGLIDDVRGLRARTKLLAQLLIAIAVCAFGIRIEGFAVRSWFNIELGWVAWPVTVIWIVGITNAVNLIDGLDGLAAGISAIACGVIFIFAAYSGQVVMAILMLCVLGSLIGFLVFNFQKGGRFR